MVATYHLVFKILKFYWLMGSEGPSCITTPNFIKIGLSVADIEIFDFSGWRPSAILDLFRAYLDHTRRVFGDLYRFAKLGCN